MIPYEDNITIAIISGELDEYLNSIFAENPCAIPYFFQTPEPNRVTDENLHTGRTQE